MRLKILPFSFIDVEVFLSPNHGNNQYEVAQRMPLAWHFDLPSLLPPCHSLTSQTTSSPWLRTHRRHFFKLNSTSTVLETTHGPPIIPPITNNQQQNAIIIIKTIPIPITAGPSPPTRHQRHTSSPRPRHPQWPRHQLLLPRPRLPRLVAHLGPRPAS